MKIFDKIYRSYFNHKYVARLKGHKTTKEIAHQLMWTLENDLLPYVEDKNIQLEFEVLPSCIVYVKAILLSKNIEKYDIDPFDGDIVWIDYRDILWSILNYQKVLNEAKERVDYIYKKIKERSDKNA